MEDKNCELSDKKLDELITKAKKKRLDFWEEIRKRNEKIKFPTMKSVHAITIATDLIPVQPMSAPTFLKNLYGI